MARLKIWFVGSLPPDQGAFNEYGFQIVIVREKPGIDLAVPADQSCSPQDIGPKLSHFRVERILPHSSAAATNGLVRQACEHRVAHDCPRQSRASVNRRRHLVSTLTFTLQEMGRC